MRKNLSPGLFFMLIFILGGCFISQSYYYSYETMKKEVENIEIIRVEINDSNEEERILKRLNNKEIDSLLKELAEIKYTFSVGDPPVPEGNCLKVYYKNGEIEIISYYGTSIRNITCSEEDFTALLRLFINLDEN